MSLDAIIPPLPLMNTGAIDLWNCMHGHKAMRSINRFERCLEGRSQFHIKLREGDGATGNDKYHLYLLKQAFGKWSDFLLCGNHSNQLIEGHMVHLAGNALGTLSRSLLNDLYAISLFIRMGGHFVRLLVAVRVHCNGLQRVLKEPPAHAALEVAEMKSYLLLKFDIASEGKTDRARNIYISILDTFFAILNGPVCERGFYHYCTQIVDLDLMKTNLANCVIRVIFPGQPGVPSMNKWTKLGPAVDWLNVACLHGILEDIVEPAFSKLEIQVEKAPDHTPMLAGDPNADPEVVAANWHKVAGARLKRLKRVVTDPIEKFMYGALAIVIEPLRFLTHLFMAFSNRPKDYSRWPPLFDLIWVEMSPIARVQQYYSSMLAGKCERLRLVYCHSNIRSFDEWKRRCPHEVLFMRRLILSVSPSYLL
jgi:hypothetical protein